MPLPSNFISKAIKNPKGVCRYSWRNFVGQYVEPQITNWHGDFLFRHDWDVAVILDACRYDLGVTSSERRDITSPKKAWSIGWDSRSWMRRTFNDADAHTLKDTAMVTANIHSEELDATSELSQCDEVWKYAWDDAAGTVPPRAVTDRAIDISRHHSPDRVLIHYMQPHLPPLNSDYNWISGLDTDEGWVEGNTWVRVENGEIDAEEVVNAYKNNIVDVLDEVELLLSNIDASKAVITADHGNALGENNVWGHHDIYSIHNGIRYVPWWEFEGSDEQTHTPANYDQTQKTSRDEQLRALGYR